MVLVRDIGKYQYIKLVLTVKVQEKINVQIAVELVGLHVVHVVVAEARIALIVLMGMLFVLHIVM